MGRNLDLLYEVLRTHWLHLKNIPSIIIMRWPNGQGYFFFSLRGTAAWYESTQGLVRTDLCPIGTMAQWYLEARPKMLNRSDGAHGGPADSQAQRFRDGQHCLAPKAGETRDFCIRDRNWVLPLKRQGSITRFCSDGTPPSPGSLYVQRC